MGPVSKIWNAVLKLLSIWIDILVVKIEMRLSGHRPMISKRVELSDLNLPEYFERPELFYNLGMKAPDVELSPYRKFAGIKESHFKFRSEMVTEYEENNIVRGRIFEARGLHGGTAAPCFIVMHGWREPGVFTPYHWLLGIILARFGINCVLTTQPYHGARKPPGTYDGDLMLSGDMELSINAFRQAVGDVRSLVTWAKTRYTGAVGVGGFSLGGFVTGLVACVEDRIDFAAPIIASGNLVKGMWDNVIIQRLKRDLETAGVTESTLMENWRVISPVNFMPKLSTDRIQIIAGKYDILIPNENVEELNNKWKGMRLVWLPCGHVSIFLCARGLVRAIVDFVNEFATPLPV